MAQIDQGAYDKLLGPLRSKQQAELDAFARKLRLDAAAKKAAAKFDMQDAMSKGDMERVFALQNSIRKADAVDQGKIMALQAEHANDQEAEKRRQLEALQARDAAYGGSSWMRPEDVREVFPAAMSARMSRPAPTVIERDAMTRMRGDGRDALEESDFGNFTGSGVRSLVANSQRSAIAARNAAALEQAVRNQKADEANSYRTGRVPDYAVKEREARMGGMNPETFDYEMEVSGTPSYSARMRAERMAQDEGMRRSLAAGNQETFSGAEEEEDAPDEDNGVPQTAVSNKARANFDPIALPFEGRRMLRSGQTLIGGLRMPY